MAEFELHLEEELFGLHRGLASGVWRPEPYAVFYVQDPKLRKIHKASVRDRVLYQAVYRKLYAVFDRGFIHDSYASRNRKGTHRGVERFAEFARKLTANYSKRGFALKCDIRKFFDGIDHEVLLALLARQISDPKLFYLIRIIIGSFETAPGKGLPLGNVTSQLFANVYLNELDQFVKHQLKAKYYIRYCDDFVILDASRERLEAHIATLRDFLSNTLLLLLHPRKVEIRKITSGVDFLGYVSLPHYRVLRTKTKRRMLRLANERNLSSYLGLCKHANAFTLEQLLKNRFPS
ncbi:MAG: reverse transcriptase/maturase family protein [bacterium]|nr:reverse transcriptase/maturase family protein [bacterium]